MIAIEKLTPEMARTESLARFQAGSGPSLSVPVTTEPTEAEAAMLVPAADALQTLGRALSSAGYEAVGLHLYAAASSIDEALPQQPGWWSGPFNATMKA